MKSTDQATRCPSCKTVFRVVADQLRVSDGWVRCGRCAHVFNATEHLMDMDRAWSRLPETSTDTPERPAAEVAPEARADAPTTRAASPDVWSAPRALSHRAKQDQDAHDIASLATQAEAARLRSNGLPPGTQLATDDGPPAPHIGPDWEAPDDDGWPTPAVAPLAFEPADGVYKNADVLSPAPPPATAAAHAQAPTLARAAQSAQAAQAAPTAQAAQAAQASQAASDLDGPDTQPLPENRAYSPPLATTPPRPEPAGPDFTPDAPGHAAYADTEPALFGPQAEISATWHTHSGAVPTLAPSPWHDMHADPEPRLPSRAAKPASAKPGFLRKAERDQHWRRPHMRALLLAGLAVGALALVAQVSLAYRDVLAARLPGSKPLLQLVCAPLGCSVEPARSIEGLAVESSGLVRVDKSALYKLQVTLRNHSNLELALPALDITFTDGKGDPIARKVLLPQELTSTIAAGGSGAGSGTGTGTVNPVSSNEVLGAGREVSLQGLLQSSAAVPEAVAGYTVELFYP